MKTDRIDLVETFVRIAETRSIGQAAEDMGVGSSTASRKLKKLEGMLKKHLIHRNTHSLALTQTGQSFLHDAKVLLNCWRRFEDRYRSHDTGKASSLRIVAPLGIGQQFMTTIAVDFRLENEDVGIVWILCDEQLKFTEAGCDLWMHFGDSHDDNLVSSEMAIIEQVLVCSSELAGVSGVCTPRHLETLPYIALGSVNDVKIELRFSIGDRLRMIRPSVVMSTNNLFALLCFACCC